MGEQCVWKKKRAEPGENDLEPVLEFMEEDSGSKVFEN